MRIFLCYSLAGISRSTTMVVAYLMTVTHYSWDECLSAVKAVRSCVGPNYGFQQQLRDYQNAQLSEVNTHEWHPDQCQDIVFILHYMVDSYWGLEIDLSPVSDGFLRRLTAHTHSDKNYVILIQITPMIFQVWMWILDFLSTCHQIKLKKVLLATTV